MFRLSEHCELPIAGILIVTSVLVTSVVLFVLFQRYRKKQEDIKSKLKISLHHHKQLIKTKRTDIALLMNAWKLTPSEVQLSEKIAQGAYGEVWKGALHNRWVVAIKKMFHASSSSSSGSSNNNSRRKSKKGTSSINTSSMFADDEIRFLMRT